LVKLIDAVPYSKDEAGSWDPLAIKTVLASISSRYGDRGYVYWRTMDRKIKRFTSGASEGKKELPAAKSMGKPVLMLFKDLSKRVTDYEYWYPTMVFPEDMPTHVYNVT